MTNLKGLAWIVLAVVLVPAFRAETHCPGDVASVPLHLVNGYQMIVAVSINQSGPYDFLLDTGAQITMIDPSLATELHLDANGSVPVAGNGFRTTSSAVKLDRLEVGPKAVTNLEALEFDVRNIRPRYPNLRGILGEDFLLQFDMLIDNDHRMLCLDDSTALRSGLKGQHTALDATSETERVPPNSLIFTVRLSDETRPIRLKLDSGANAPVLYNATSEFKPIDLIDMAGGLRGTGASGSQTAYMALPPQDVKIGREQLPNIPFFAPTKDISNTMDFDGLLPSRLFQRVFISRGEQYAILEAR
jgi:hypothetical protein